MCIGLYIYLTIWGLTLQAVYFLVALACDLVRLRRLGLSEYRSDLRLMEQLSPDTSRDSMRQSSLDEDTDNMLLLLDRFFSLIFVTGNLIGVIYWFAIFTDPLDPAHNDVPSFVMTFFQHGTTWIFVYVELYCSHRQYGKPTTGLAVTFSFLLLYTAWNLACYNINGHWTYDLQEVLATYWWTIILGYGAIAVFVVGLYFWGQWLSSKRWTWHLDSAEHTDKGTITTTSSTTAKTTNSSSDNVDNICPY